MRFARIVSVALLATAAVAADPVPEYTAQASRTFTISGVDAKDLAKVALFITEDGGKTWRKAQELPVAEGATQIPALGFTADHDGAFGLWTVATKRDGHAEAEPVAGMPPKSLLVVDRAAPALALLEATLGAVTADQANLAISWRVTDPNLGKEPVALEVSSDQGRTFTARPAGPAEGTTGLTVPVTATTSEIQVRVVARDLAGNVLTSPAKAVALPVQAKPEDPTAALLAAVAALPKPEELGAARGGAPIITAGENPVAATPVAPKPKSEDGAEASTATPAVKADAPVRALEPDPAVPYLTGSTAESELSRARDLQDSDADTALALYLRLHRSSVSTEAVAAEFALLEHLGEQPTLLGIANALPPELRTDAARLAAGRAALAVGDPATAARWAAGVHNNVPESRPATLVLGRALKAQGRSEDAKRLFERLAKGDDEIAASARSEQ